MNPAIVAIIAIVAGSVLIAGWVVISERLDRPPAGRHNPFADPADRTDPYGAEWPPRPEPDDDFFEQYVPIGQPAGRLPMLPPDPEPDLTIVEDHDVKYLGKTSTALVEELFEKHAAAEGAEGS
jgi:hypothetical protein